MRFKPRSSVGLALSMLSAAAVCQGPPAGFRMETVTKGTFQGSCAMAFAPDGRLFIAERGTAKSGQLCRMWLSTKKLTVPTQTPFGNLWVPFDLFLPDATVGADDRAYVGVPIPNVPAFRGLRVYAQAAVAAGSTVSLTPPTELVLR